jgi:hypothetical protein
MSNHRSLWGSRISRTFVALIVVFGSGALLIWGFIEGRGEAALEAQRERPVNVPLRVSTENGAPIITLDADTRRRSGIRTSALQTAPYHEQVRAYATVLDAGRLTDLSNSYANAKAQLETARAKLAASKTAFDRAQNLYEDQQNVSLAQLQAAQATYRADQAALSAAESQVRAFAATAQQEWGPVLGRSVVEGTSIVARLIERQDFLLQVTLPPGVFVPPPPLAAVETGKSARIAITFVSLATRTDPKIQGTSFFYVAPARSGVLPGMNVLALLPSGASVDGVRVPASAIVWWQDRAWVYRRTGSDTFTRVAIATDLPAPGGGYIVRELPKESELVTEGAQLLLSEEFRAQIRVGGD